MKRYVYEVAIFGEKSSLTAYLVALQRKCGENKIARHVLPTRIYYNNSSNADSTVALCQAVFLRRGFAVLVSAHRFAGEAIL